MTGNLFADSSIVAPAQAGRYQTVYADPPWNEAGGGKTRRGANRHYQLMKTRDICALPVRHWSTEDAHLYLWVTNSFLEDGFDVMKAWGFNYKTTITWFKSKDQSDDDASLQMGIGQYFRGCTEHCLFGVRGVIPYRFLPSGKRAQGLTGFHAVRGEHSEKPQTMREMIERVSPGPYLEMFARKPVEGWDVWGNESSGERLSA